MITGLKIARTFTKNNNRTMPILHVLNGLAISIRERVEQIPSNIENVPHLTDNMNDDRTDRVFNKTYKNVLNEPVRIDEIELVTPKEIKNAISTTKAKKAPRLVGIENIALKNLSK